MTPRSSVAGLPAGRQACQLCAGRGDQFLVGFRAGAGPGPGRQLRLAGLAGRTGRAGRGRAPAGCLRDAPPGTYG